MSEYFPEPKPLEENVKVELDLFNYVKKGDLKNTGSFDTSKIAKTVDLASLKSEVDKLDIGKLETTPVELSKLSHVVKAEVVQNTIYQKLVKKFNDFQTTDTSNLVKKLTITQKILKLRRKNLIMIMVNILPHKNSIS